jgi:eukaryotic-like serine/threonine-protein kinase
MNSVFKDCPADDELAGHLLGQLDADRADAIRHHLDECESCMAVTMALVQAKGTPPGAGVAGALHRHEKIDGLGNVSRYQVLRMIGSGGMGVVYAAHDPSLHRSVALKVLKPDMAQLHPILTDRLMKVSRLLARVSDPAVITVYDAGLHNDQVFLAMELIDGETLGDWFRQRRTQPVDCDAIIDIFLRAGAGLLAAHSAGVLHRDFKPDNVLLSPANARLPKRVVVTDFGLALDYDIDQNSIAGVHQINNWERNQLDPIKLAGIDKVALTATGMAVGTPAYMSPEQLRCQSIDVRSDIFALGVSMWELLHRERPFVGQNASELIAAIARGPQSGSKQASNAEPRQPGANQSIASVQGRSSHTFERKQPAVSLPPRLQTLLRQMLASEPADRPQTMEVVLAQLQQCKPTPRVRNRIALGVFALAVAAAIGGATMFTAKGDAPGETDPCRASQQGLTVVWNTGAAANLKSSLINAGLTIDAANGIVSGLQSWASDIGTYQQQMCRQPLSHNVNACIAARMNELQAVTTVMTSIEPSSVTLAVELLEHRLQASICSSDGVSVSESRWPLHQRMWPRVAQIRLQFKAIANLRDAGRVRDAYNAVNALDDAVNAVGWPAIYAEQQYLLGSVEEFGIDPVKALQTYRKAAAVAERVRHDYLAASIWNAISQMSTSLEGSAVRGLEYANYADAASSRIGRPDAINAMTLYSRGVANILLGKLVDAEQQLGAALKLANTSSPRAVTGLLQGMGDLAGARGDFEQAVRFYRETVARLSEQGKSQTAAMIVNKIRLATNLNHCGRMEEALIEAQQAALLADKLLDEKSIDLSAAHAAYATALGVVGRYEQATVQIEIAMHFTTLQLGKRSSSYGKLLGVSSSLLLAQGKSRLAAETATKSCEIEAYATGDDSFETATCWAETVQTQIVMGQFQTALARIDAALPIIQKNLPANHAVIFTAMVGKGQALLGLGRLDQAIPAFELGLEGMMKADFRQDYIADAEFGLARALAKVNTARARTLAGQAIARWQADPLGWEVELKSANKWLRAHGGR